MKITVIPDDKKITVDGRALKNKDFVFPVNIHAIHWDGEKGHIEYKDKRPNAKVPSRNYVQTYVDQHTAEADRLDNIPDTPTPKPEPTPAEAAKKALADLKAAQGSKPLSMAYLDKRLTEIETILGV
jgi:hypothetical protein